MLESQQAADDDRKARKATVRDVSARLGDILRRHSEGEPILAEIAARIQERDTSFDRLTAEE